MTTESTTAGASTTDTAAATGADLPTASTLLTDGGGAQAGAEDLTAGAEGATDGATTEAEGKPADGDSAAKGAPEAYEDFKLPEDAKLAPEVLESTKTLAKELDLSQDQAQKVADLLAQASTTSSQAATAALADRFKATTTQWLAELKADKEIGGDKLDASVAKARAAMEAVAAPELVALLRHSGLGDNVHVVKHFLRIAPAVLQDRTVQSGNQPGGPRKSAAERLYGHTTT